ncbi:MAG: hypothetical protein KKG75_03630 [Nanoarchaeota archaeon]|nr:hypothetical protein [Nanoarchaeota archaeon]
MRNYNPYGDEYERILYASCGHPDVLDPELMRRFQEYLRENLGAPAFAISLRFQALLLEEADTLLSIATDFDEVDVDTA